MVKVLAPDESIIGVYETRDDVPPMVPDRFCSHCYPKEDLEIVEVTDPKEQQRLQKTLERGKREEGSQGDETQ